MTEAAGLRDWNAPDTLAHLAQAHPGFLAALASLLKTLVSRTGARVLVDSSKSPEFALACHLTGVADLYVLNLIREAGISGMGGAGFPTSIKLRPPSDRKVSTLIINGAECEPYITADDMAMRERADQIHLGGYPQVVARMGEEDGSGRSADPMDIPHAMSHVLGMAPGTRPVRLPVSSGAIPQTAINEVSAKTQVGWLGESGYGPLIKAVHQK